MEDAGQENNDYEAERLARIQRNKDRMAELGLHDAVDAVLQERAARGGARERSSGGRRRKQSVAGEEQGQEGAAPPPRRSARQAGGPVEFPLLLDLPDDREWEFEGDEGGLIELDAQPAALDGNRKRRRVVVQQPRGQSKKAVMKVEGPLDDKARQREENKMKRLDKHNLMRLAYMSDKAMR